MIIFQQFMISNLTTTLYCTTPRVLARWLVANWQLLLVSLCERRVPVRKRYMKSWSLTVNYCATSQPHRCWSVHLLRFAISGIAEFVDYPRPAAFESTPPVAPSWRRFVSHKLNLVLASTIIVTDVHIWKGVDDIFNLM